MSKSFGDKILELRKEKKISQEELGKIIGVSKLSIFKYENNINKARRNNLIKLAEYFNVPVEYFNDNTYEPMQSLVSIVSSGGSSSANTLKYRVNISNRWMQVMGVSIDDKFVDLLYKDKVIIIQKAGGLYDASYEKTTVTVKMSVAGGGATPGTKRYMIVLRNKWMQEMQITNDTKENRTVELQFDGEKILITKS